MKRSTLFLSAVGFFGAAFGIAFAVESYAHSHLLSAAIIAAASVAGFVILNQFSIRTVNVMLEKARRQASLLANSMREREGTEAELRREQLRLKQLFDNSPIASVTADNNDRVIRINEAFTSLFGYTQEEAAGKTLNELIVPPHLWGESIAFSSLTIRGERVQRNSVRRKKDGSPVNVTIVGIPVSLDDVPDGIYSMYVDIGAQKKMEQTLLRIAEGLATVHGNDFFRIVAKTLAEAIGADAVIIAEFAGSQREKLRTIIQYVDRRFRSVIEFPVQNSPCGMVTPQKLCVIPTGALAQFPNHPLVKELAAEGYCGAALTDSAGQFVGVIAALFRSPVTEVAFVESVLKIFASRTAVELQRIYAERDLRSSEDKFSKAFKISPDAININRMRDGFFVEINEGFTKLTGYTENDVRGKSSIDINIWANIDDRKRLVQQLQERGEVVGLEAQFRMKDGTIRYGLMSARLVTLDGEPHILSITRDITEKRMIDESMRQTQKLEAIGKLAGGIAHDFNNILMIILGQGEMALRKIEADHPVAEKLKAIHAAAERAASLTKQLLAFSRKQTLEIKPCNLNDIIEETGVMLTRLIGEDISLTVRKTDPLPNVLVDKAQVEQVIINLVLNARDAMPKGGALSIATSVAKIDAASLALHPDAKEGDYALMSVSDTGVGIASEAMEHMFEPFYTTKERGKGTGLGLATVYGIARQHGGFTTVYSEPGKGSTFRVYFPVTGAVTSEEDAATREEAVQGNGERIFVVEDEDGVRDIAVDALQAHGFTVLSARNPAEAIEQMALENDTVELLLTDVVLPGMTGKDLYQLLRTKTEALKVLYMSGYTADIIAHHGVLEEGANFIQKPFTLLSLIKKVRSVLDS